MAGEHSDRKKHKKHDSLTATVQALDVETVTAAIRAAKLASFMRGGITAAAVGPIMKSPSFRGLIKEMFLAVVTDHGDATLDVVRKSMTMVMTAGLHSKGSESDIQYFCDNVVAALTEACEAVVSAVRESNPATLVSLQNTGLLKRLTTVLENIEQHSNSLAVASSLEALERRRVWLTTYRTLCERAHGYIVPPDFDTSRKIPMANLYVTPTVSGGGPNAYRDGAGMNFDVFRSTIDRTVLLGDPGGGKSTLSNYLAAYWATSDDGIVPFHVTLREYAKQPSELSIAKYIEHQLDAHYQHAAPEGLVEELLLSGEAVVIFDGLDELIDTTKRRAISSLVEIFGIKYPLTGILVTSRRVGYDQARLDPDVYRVRVISEFRPSDVHDYVHKWFSSQEDYSEQEADRLATSFIEQSESVKDLRANPLMLALMCIIFRGENFIPRNRPAVYEKCSTLLFEKWDGHRAIEVPLEARAHVNAALMYVAHWMLVTGSGDAGVPYDKLVREMSTYLRGRAFETEDTATRAATEFVDFCRGRAWVFSDAGTTADGEPLFTFTHRTFMEYFAAFHLTRVNDTPEKLARALLPKVAAEDWDVVAQLAVQIEDKAVDQGSERALRVMIDEPRKRTLYGRANILDFVCRCAVFSTLSPSFMRDLTQRCLAVMFEHLGGSPRNEISVMGPWLSLTRAALFSHQETVADVHRKFVAEALAERGSDQWKAACEFLSMSIGTTWPSTIRSNSQWSKWWSTFQEIAQDSATELLAFAVEHPSHRPSLVVAGILPPEQAVKSYQDEGADFIEAYFGHLNPEFRYFRVSTLASILWELAGSPMAMKTGPEAECGEPLANAFLHDFWNSKRTIGAASRDNFARISYGEEMSLELNKPQAILDAGFLVALSEHEILTHIFSGLYPGAPAGYIQNVLDVRAERLGYEDLDFSKLPLSEPVLEFAKKWAKGEINVFEDTVHETPRCDMRGRTTSIGAFLEDASEGELY